MNSGLYRSCLFLVFLGFLAWPAFSEEKRPNILMLLAEDLGYGVLGCYGQTNAETPHIDTLAEEGIRLTHYYSAGCTPKPAIVSLLTGRYPQRVKPETDTFDPWPENDTTLVAWLRAEKYSTAWIGDGLSFPEESKEFHGFEHVEEAGAGKHPGVNALEKAQEWLHEQEKKPWLLSVHLGRCSGSEIQAIDYAVGALLDTIKQTGNEDNTFVLFCGLNGNSIPEENRPFSGGRDHLREGGIRVPCIVRWPRYLPAGKVCAQMSMSMDLSATILLGARKRPQRHIDGMDLIRILNGSRNEVEQTLVWQNDKHEEIALRWGKWKWLQEEGTDFLFNLSQDSQEQVNVKKEHIDIFHWLKGIYRQWEEAMKK